MHANTMPRWKDIRDDLKEPVVVDHQSGTNSRQLPTYPGLDTIVNVPKCQNMHCSEILQEHQRATFRTTGLNYHAKCYIS